MPKLVNETDRKTGRPAEREQPKTIGSGFVTSVLGEGGAAIVYEIWNPKLEIHRAVKLWRPNVSEKDLQRFETEIKITSKLDHPNIVEIHTVGEWNGLPYIEMERIDGLSLQQIVRTNGALPPVVAVAIMIFICRALLYAHQEEFSLYGRKRKGVIHCDIKPANIMITKSGVVKLMDFGIANPTNVSLHTAADRVTGSLQYMAPEQIRSKQIDARTDIYSIGVVLYEILSGTKAFPSKQLLEVIEKRKQNDYVPLNQFCTNLPRRFYRVVSCCMQLEPEDRYQNIQDLMKELTAGFKSLSHNDPEAVIQQFLETGVVPVHKIPVARSILIPAVAAIVPTSLLVITLVAVILKTNKDDAIRAIIPGKSQEIGAIVTPGSANLSNGSSGEIKRENISTPIQEIVPLPVQEVVPPPIPEVKSPPVPEVTPLPVEEVIPPPIPEVKSPPVPEVTPPPVQTVKTEKKVVKATKKVSPDEEQLIYLESLVEKGKLSNALNQFSQQEINDGAYYSLYARCLYESGEWEKAFEMAEKSTKIPSKRVPAKYRNGQLLLYKAKYNSYLFDNKKDQSSARSAINAWWDVREFFDGTAKATFAESEINRLSAFIGENIESVRSK